MPNKSTRQKTYKQKQAEVKALSSQMDRAVGSYFDNPEKLKQYLSFMSQFHRYSPANVALIEKQFPGAEAVGSFQFWKSKGYAVRKGEHGEKIWVPIPVPAKFQTKTGEWKSVRQATAQEKVALEQGALRQIEAHRGYTVGTVFDISQTTCPIEKLPELFPNRHVTGEIKAFDHWKRGLREIAKKLGVTIDETSPYTSGAAKGVFIPRLNKIQLNPRNTPFENATVLTHELAHAALHPLGKSLKTTVGEKEFQAEMTAYVVHAHFGIDTENESLRYLASWTKDKTLADKKKLIGEVHETSLSFISTLETELAKGKEREVGGAKKANNLPAYSLPARPSKANVSSRHRLTSPMANR
ncbi:MAG: ArdC-like ssDNA-binding domain-containing protein [Sporolactobacillus sp.]